MFSKRQDISFTVGTENSSVILLKRRRRNKITAFEKIGMNT